MGNNLCAGTDRLDDEGEPVDTIIRQKVNKNKLLAKARADSAGDVEDARAAYEKAKAALGDAARSSSPEPEEPAEMEAKKTEAETRKEARAQKARISSRTVSTI